MEVNALEKRFHGNIAEYTKIAYGIPLSGNFAILPKINVITAIETIGCIIAHKNPNIVCLYLTIISFHDKKNITSL
jgi:hypothetical protein